MAKAISKTRKPPRTAEERKRWLRSAAYLIVALVLVGLPLLLAGHWMTALGQRPITEVTVSGVLHHVSPTQLKTLLGPSLERGYFGVDVSRMRATLEALPWVERAQVRQSWPNRLEIGIHEHVPRARWGDHELLSYTGERFRPLPATIPEGLPLLSGPADSEHRIMTQYRQFSDLLKIAGLGIRGVSMDSRGSWRVILDNGLVMLLGRERMEKRLWRIARVYPVVVKPRVDDIERVDLRYSNGFAISWRNAADVKL
jgi:cell division protein FtsQ